MKHHHQNKPGQPDPQGSGDPENYRLLNQLREDSALQERSFTLSNEAQFKEFQEVVSQLVFFRCPYRMVRLEGMAFLFVLATDANFLGVSSHREHLKKTLNEERK